MSSANLTAAGAAKYVSLTTFRKSGEGVATPVWVAPAVDGDHLVVISDANAWKVKRLARDPRVELRPCDGRGRVADGAPTWTGTGTVAFGEAEISAVRAALGKKYGVVYTLFRLGQKIAAPFRPKAAGAALQITLT